MKKQMSFWLIVIVCGVSLGIPSVRAAEKHVEISCSPWQPYCGEELSHGGIFSEIVTAAYARKGYTVRYTDMPWARVLETVKDGDLDAAACAYYTEERNETYFFSDPVMQGGALVLYKKKGTDITAWKTMEDLRGYRIGVLRGSAYTSEFDQADFLEKEAASSELFNLKKLLAGRLDLVLMDPAVANYFIRQYLTDQEEFDTDEFDTVSPPLNEGQSVYLMFSRAIPDIQIKIQALNEGLKEIREDGTYNDILQKYGLSK